VRIRGGRRPRSVAAPSRLTYAVVHRCPTLQRSLPCFLFFLSCMTVPLAGCSDEGTRPPPPSNTWSTFGQGFSLPVRALASFDGDLIAGGDFYLAGGNTVNGIARWDGANWIPLGSGLSGGEDGERCCALAIYQGDLVAAGDFLTAGGADAPYVARWDGSLWAPVGSGTDGKVLALIPYGDGIVAGGSFGIAGGAAAPGIAIWNGARWSALDSGALHGVRPVLVRALTVYHEDLIAGGEFVEGIAPAVRAVARWDGLAWSVLGQTMDDDVLALTVWNDQIVAGGWFTSVGDAALPGVAQWDGAAWRPVGSGVSVALEGFPATGVICLHTFGADLMAGGSFRKAGGNWANCIARWNGAAWSAIGGTDMNVITLLVHDDALILGGGFTWAGGITANRIARWGQ
jgi:hypothetical protein